jgi:hypothetical protein
MQRIILFLVFLIISVSSCKNYQTFKVEGIVANKIFNGSIVYLVALDAPITKNVDSTIIKNGSFSFTIRADSTVAKILRVPLKYPYAVEDLVVITEPGTIQVVLNEKSSGKGTRLNEILQQWKEDKHLFDSVQWSLFKYKDLSKLRKETFDSLMNTSNKQMNSFLSGVIKTIDENLYNGIGLLLFKVYLDQIPPAKKDSIMKVTGGEYLRKDAQLRNMIQ